MQKQNKKILVTGSNGYIGSSLSSFLSNQNYNVISINRKNFDLTDFKSLNSFLKKKYFDVVIHTASKISSRLKEDDWKDLDCNLKMYYNLLQHKSHFTKLINLGSGAEIYDTKSPYGISKMVISKSVLENENFFNIRIFAVFDENELNTRFIKSNIIRYIQKKPMFVQNKKMTFFYMKDFLKLIDFYVKSPTSCLFKEVECSYKKSYSLFDLACMINNLNNYKVPIMIDSQDAKDYESQLKIFYKIKYMGLKKGIQETYFNLLKDVN